jgi:hypothetical protein
MFVSASTFRGLLFLELLMKRETRKKAVWASGTGEEVAFIIGRAIH